MQETTHKGAYIMLAPDCTIWNRCNQYRNHMYYSEDSDIKTCNTVKLRKHRRTE